MKLHINLITDAELERKCREYFEAGKAEGLGNQSAVFQAGRVDGYRLGKQAGITEAENRYLTVDTAVQAHELLREIGLD